MFFSRKKYTGGGSDSDPGQFMFRRRKATFKVVVHGISEENPHTVNLPHKVRTRGEQTLVFSLTSLDTHLNISGYYLLASLDRFYVFKSKGVLLFCILRVIYAKCSFISGLSLLTIYFSRLFARNCKEMQTGVRGRD